MSIKTFPEAKDYILASLIGIQIFQAYDIKREVAKLHDDNIIASHEIESIKEKLNLISSESREKDKEQDSRMNDFEAILNDNHIYPRKKYAERED